MQHPLKNFTGEYGYKHGDWTFYLTKHKGYDFIVSESTPVYACLSGTIDAGNDWNGGNFIYIYSDDGKMTSRYFHLILLSSRIATRGSQIKEGDLVGYSGQTGFLCRGAHLHWDLQIDGKFVDPLLYISRDELELTLNNMPKLEEFKKQFTEELKQNFVQKDNRFKFDEKGTPWIVNNGKKYRVGSKRDDVNIVFVKMATGQMTETEKNYPTTNSRKEVL